MIGNSRYSVVQFLSSEAFLFIANHGDPETLIFRPGTGCTLLHIVEQFASSIVLAWPTVDIGDSRFMGLGNSDVVRHERDHLRIVEPNMDDSCVVELNSVDLHESWRAQPSKMS